MSDKLNRIDVDLHLLATEDIKLLREISENFKMGVRGSGRKTGFSYTQAGDTAVGRSDGLESQGGGSPQPGAHDPNGGILGKNQYGENRTYYSNFLEGMLGKGSRGSALGWPMRQAQGIGRDVDALSMAALGLPNLVRGTLGGIQGMVSPLRATGNVSYGANLGYNTTGGIIPFTSQAGVAGLMNQTIHPLGNLFNLNFSPGQAKSTNEAIQSFGYDPFGAGRGTQMRQSMEALTKQYGNAIPSSEMAGMLDPARYGGSSISGLTAQISMLDAAAKGANVTVSHMAESLAQVSQQIAQQLGTSGEIAGGQALAMSAGSGFSPEIAAKPMMSKLTQGMMIGAAGGDVFNAFFGKGAASNAFKSVEMIVQGLTGMNFTQLGTALKGPNAHAIKNMLATAYYSNPEIFGGYTLEQVMDLANRGDQKIYAGTKLSGDIGSSIRANAHAGHDGALTMSQLYTEARKAGLSSSEIAKLKSGGGSYHDQVNSLKNAMGDYNKKLQQQNSNSTYLELTGYAKRLLQKVVPDGSSSDVNLGRFSGMPSSPTKDYRL